MGKTQEEIQKELDESKKQVVIDSNRRKLLYANAETEIIMLEKKQEAIKLFFNIVQKYGISNEDIVVLLENVPYV